MSLAGVGLALGGASLATSLIGGKKAQDDMRDAAKAQAKATLQQRMDELRREAEANRYKLGAARASAYASGLQMSGSTQRYVQRLKQQQRAQEVGMETSAYAESEAIMQGATGNMRGQTLAAGLKFGADLLNYMETKPSETP